MDETLVIQGGEVKALGEGKIGGYLVLFGDKSNTDLARDFFTPETDFGSHKTSAVIYHHGMDKKVKRQVFDSEAPLKTDDIGVWIEAQLNMRNEYEQAVYGMVKAKKLGWSSGTAPHLVERKQVGNAFEIKRWPLGLDASLTPAPCEPRTMATSLKSLTDEYEAKGLSEFLITDMTLAAVRVAHDSMYYQICNAVWESETPLKDRIADLRNSFDECRDLSVRVIKQIISADPPEEQKSAQDILKDFRSVVLTAADFDDHSDMVLTACREYVKRADSLIARRTRNHRTVSDDRLQAFKALASELDALVKAATPGPDTSVQIRQLQASHLRRQADLRSALVGDPV